ncbi:hypothetical protein DDN98_06605 [Vibrio cholerae]|nr:hypothetical protein [Vibrio cholerae]EGR2495244.1 hypothetical protein [Vibrio cholerae]EGR4293455.1 hypothetical protein [Vibrio cholerae]EGR4296983.1 hypothetical protein [Vibrio cholerae]TXZ54744.1 hypothetical protein FXE54_06525 [Vibrio cholerae]
MLIVLFHYLLIDKSIKLIPLQTHNLVAEFNMINWFILIKQFLLKRILDHTLESITLYHEHLARIHSY